MKAMNERPFVLIAGRTTKQGCGISEGKQTAGFLAETTAIQLSPEDFVSLDLTEGDRVRIRSRHGEAVLPAISSKGGELPKGVLFIAYGDCSCRLMGADTHGSGMPTSKGIDVLLEKVM